jgi:hypothetical protein
MMHRAWSFAVLLAAMPSCSPAAGPAPANPLAAPAPQASDAEAELLASGWKLLVNLQQPPLLPVIMDHERILQKLVGSHRDKREECTGQGPSVIAVLQGGIEGAFSGPGAKERAYLVTTTGCDAPADKDTDTHRFVIMDGDKVVLDKEVAEHTLVAVQDLDADGDNEVLLLSGHRDDAAGSMSARLIDTEGGEFQELFDFGEVSTTRCTQQKRFLASGSIVYRKQGDSMEYKLVRRVLPCP